MVEESLSVRERERVHMVKEEEEKSPKYHFAMAGKVIWALWSSHCPREAKTKVLILFKVKD